MNVPLRFLNILLITWALVLGPTFPLLALSLSEAKDQGLVGERPSGYLGIVGAAPSSGVEGLVTDINRQRREKYQEIATRNHTNLQAVELLAGKTAIEKTLPGHYVQLPSGNWVKK